MLISVIVPCFNAQRTLGACLESLVAQELAGADFEVIAVDDGSTDQSLEIAARFGCQTIGNPKNMGPGVARNLGAARARGEILAFTDSDCIVPRDWLAKILAHFGNAEVAAVWGGYSGSVRKTAIEEFAFLECLHRQTQLDFHLELSSTSNFACRKSAFARVGGFPQYALWWHDPRERPFWGNEDMDIAYLLYREFPGGMVWDGDNGVRHHFRPTLWKYCQQQAFFASASAVSYAVFPQLRQVGSGAGRQSALLQLASTLPLGLLVLAGQWPALLAAPLLSLLAVPLLNCRFFTVARQRGKGRSDLVRFAFYLLARNLAWGAGSARGVVWGIGALIGRTSNQTARIASSPSR